MELEAIFSCLVERGDCVFDVGAYIGALFRPLAELVGEHGKVFAFEANPLTFTHTARAAAGFPPGLIRPYLRAMSRAPGHIELCGPLDVTGPNGQASTIMPGLATTARLGENFARYLVEADSIDNFCRLHGVRPQVLKIDVEGAEQEVLDGAKQLIGEHRPSMIIEFGISGGAVTTDGAKLEQLGYRLFIGEVMMFRGRWLDAIDPLHCPALLPLPSGDFQKFNPILFNLVAIHESRLDSGRIQAFVSPASAADYFERHAKVD